MLQLYTQAVHEALGFQVGYAIEPLGEYTAWKHTTRIILQLLGYIAAALFLATTTANVMRMNRTKEEIIQACNFFLQTHSIPSDLARRFRKYSAFFSNHVNRVARREKARDLIKQLPNALQADLCEQVYRRVVCKSAFFEIWQHWFPSVVMQICVEATKETVVAAEDRIFTTGYEARNMIFVLSGSFSYAYQHASEGPCVEDVGKKSILCEVALWSNCVHSGTLTSTSRSLLPMMASARCRRDITLADDS
eukprot:TRINITY_DN18327_c0_g1_i1.p1 TRINITY_DN18327_c0_g1~~TRINITY_DN18327_c0_g1_i1.p1  ORF type:complete len:258 (+),score=42.92 TRINITY_DN18327_c0_g1_i1:26-775(+)